MKKTSILFRIALIGTLGLGACGETYTSNTTKGSDTISTTAPGAEDPSNQSDDAKLVAELVESMHGGIAVMKQAQMKSKMKPVTDLAKKLETEHTMLTNEMIAMAGKKGWTVPSVPSEEDRKKADELMKESSPDYEKDWLSTLKDKHETNVKKLEDHKTDDADLKAASAKAIPKLHELLSRIEMVQKEMK